MRTCVYKLRTICISDPEEYRTTIRQDNAQFNVFYVT